MEVLNVPKNTIVLTGASGWVGRNFLNELQKIIPREEFNQKVKAFGSKKSEIFIRHYKSKVNIKIPIFPLKSIEEVIKERENIFFIHTAFLTREKLNNLGLNKYINFNQNITQTVLNFLEKCINPKVLVISSGAATQLENKKISDKILLKNPYAFLKLEEEKKISNVCESLILRIYALTGKFIRDPNIFAFGSFILSALDDKPIKIDSKNRVIRSYAHGSDIANLGLCWLLAKKRINDNLIYAASHTLSIHEMALRISKIYNLGDVISNIDYNLEANNYICETNKFNNYLKFFQLEATDLNQQIKITYDYLKELNFKSF